MKNNRIQDRLNSFERELHKTLKTGKGKYQHLTCKHIWALLVFVEKFQSAFIGVLDWEYVMDSFIELDLDEDCDFLSDFVPTTLGRYLYSKTEVYEGEID